MHLNTRVTKQELLHLRFLFMKWLNDYSQLGTTHNIDLFSTI